MSIGHVCSISSIFFSFYFIPNFWLFFFLFSFIFILLYTAIFPLSLFLIAFGLSKFVVFLRLSCLVTNVYRTAYDTVRLYTQTNDFDAALSPCCMRAIVRLFGIYSLCVFVHLSFHSLILLLVYILLLFDFFLSCCCSKCSVLKCFTVMLYDKERLVYV